MHTPWSFVHDKELLQWGNWSIWGQKTITWTFSSVIFLTSKYRFLTYSSPWHLPWQLRTVLSTMLCVTIAAGWQQERSNKKKSFPFVNIMLEKQFMKGASIRHFFKGHTHITRTCFLSLWMWSLVKIMINDDFGNHDQFVIKMLKKPVMIQCKEVCIQEKWRHEYHKWDSHLKKFPVTALTSLDAFIELKTWLYLQCIWNRWKITSKLQP